jgi:hypothetical protein
MTRTFAGRPRIMAVISTSDSVTSNGMRSITPGRARPSGSTTISLLFTPARIWT